MKRIILFGTVFILLYSYSCNDSGSSGKTVSGEPTGVIKDTVPCDSVYVKIQPPATFNKRFPPPPILWGDFIEDTAEFGKFKRSLPTGTKNFVPIAIRYNINELASWLNDLKGNGIDSVDIYLARYPNAAAHTGSGSSISANRRNKFTVALAGKGTSQTTTPQILPYNVGNPWP